MASGTGTIVRGTGDVPEVPVVLSGQTSSLLFSLASDSTLVGPLKVSVQNTPLPVDLVTSVVFTAPNPGATGTFDTVEPEARSLQRVFVSRPPVGFSILSSTGYSTPATSGTYAVKLCDWPTYATRCELRFNASTVSSSIGRVPFGLLLSYQTTEAAVVSEATSIGFNGTVNQVMWSPFEDYDDVAQELVIPTMATMSKLLLSLAYSGGTSVGDESLVCELPRPLAVCGAWVVFFNPFAAALTVHATVRVARIGS